MVFGPNRFGAPLGFPPFRRKFCPIIWKVSRASGQEEDSFRIYARPGKNVRCKRYKRAAYKVKSERNKITRRILRARNRISRNRISHLWTRGNIPHRSSVRNTLFVIAGFRSKTRINGGDYRKLIFSPRLRALERLFAGKQKHPLKRDYEDFFFPFSKHPCTRFENSRNARRTYPSLGRDASIILFAV